MVLWVIVLVLSAAGLARVSDVGGLILVMVFPAVLAALVIAALVPVVALFVVVRTIVKGPRASRRWHAVIAVAAMTAAGPLLAAGTGGRIRGPPTAHAFAP